ncbi:uncharacterized protein LOC117335753 [Pecten maximus]|uniref:uncharacterized protein LOC117335753 n=1 Tax=Pecten maximus TaxID=6579 RepID=UPI001458BC7C|nr:uncharacterized protein LOC117335753 [Pecten maximus]
MAGQVAVERTIDVSSEKCRDHNRPVEYSCKTCKGDFVCRKCVVSGHSGHIMDDVQDFISEQKWEVLKVLNDTDDRLKQLGLDYANVKERMDVNENESQILVSQIEKRGKILKAHIDEIVESGRKKSERYQRKNNRRLKKVLQEITDVKTKLEQKVNKCRDLVHSRKYKDFKKSVHLGNELEKNASASHGETSTRSQTFIAPPPFEDITVLEALFGKLQIDTSQLNSVSVKLKSSFRNRDDEAVYRICPVMDGNSAWVSGDECILHLVTFAGDFLKKLELNSGVNDLCCMTQSNDVTSLVVACEDNTLKKISQEEEEDETFGIELFQFESDPQSISVTAENDIVLVTPGHVTPVKVDMRGKRKPFVSKNEEGMVLTTPNTIRVNTDTGDLAILNNEPGCLYVCDEKLNLKFKYNGQENEDDQMEASDFDPQGVTFDRDHNILVADQGRRRVILLDKEGHFLKTLISKIEDEPLTVEMVQESTTHVLWVGYSSGKIETYEYIFN